MTHERALRELQSDQQLRAFQAQSGDLMDEALRENEAIEQQGLEVCCSARGPA